MRRYRSAMGRNDKRFVGAVEESKLSGFSPQYRLFNYAVVMPLSMPTPGARALPELVKTRAPALRGPQGGFGLPPRGYDVCLIRLPEPVPAESCSGLVPPPFESLRDGFGLRRRGCDVCPIARLPARRRLWPLSTPLREDALREEG